MVGVSTTLGVTLVGMRMSDDIDATAVGFSQAVLTRGVIRFKSTLRLLAKFRSPSDPFQGLDGRVLTPSTPVHSRFANGVAPLSIAVGGATTFTSAGNTFSNCAATTAAASDDVG